MGLSKPVAGLIMTPHTKFLIGSIEERDSDLLVTIIHEPLASKEETIMKFLDEHATIRNKKAREITFVKDADQMKRILQKMVEKELIDSVPGTRAGGFAYRKRQKITVVP